MVKEFRETFSAVVANGQGEMKGKLFRIAHIGYYDYWIRWAFWRRWSMC